MTGTAVIAGMGTAFTVIHYNIGVKPTHPFVIVCFDVFHCEIHGMVPLWQINMLPFYHLRKWGWGQLYAGMDGDGDDLETSCGDRGGGGDQSSGDGRGWVTCKMSVPMQLSSPYFKSKLNKKHKCIHTTLCLGEVAFDWWRGIHPLIHSGSTTDGKRTKASWTKAHPTDRWSPLTKAKWQIAVVC